MVNLKVAVLLVLFSVLAKLGSSYSTSDLDSIFDAIYTLSSESPYEALKEAENFERLAIKENSKEYIGYAYYLKAETYLGIVEYSLASDYYLKALEIFEELDNQVGIGCVYNGLGTLYSFYDLNEEAIFYYKKGLEADSTISDLEDVFTTKCNIARSKLALGDYVSAKRILNQVETESLKAKDSSSYYLVKEIKADIIFYEEDYETYAEWIIDVLKYHERNHHQSELASLHYYLSDCYYYMGMLDKCEYEMELGKKLENDITPNITSNYYYLLKESLCVARNQYKEAYNATVGYYNNEQKKKELDGTGTIELIKAEYEFKKTLDELELKASLDKQKASIKLESEKSKRVYLYLVVGLVLLTTGVVVFFLRKERKMNDSLLGFNKNLDEKNRALNNEIALKEKLIGIIAHDSRSPIASISGTLNMINEDDIDKSVQQHLLQKLEAKTNIALDTLNGVISWAKFQMHGSKVNLTAVSVKNTVDLLTKQISLEFESKKLSIKSEIPPEVYVLADKDLLAFTLKNLLVNAAKFSFELGVIQVDTKQHSASKIQIDITDYGIGMTEGEINELFKLSSKSTLGTNKEKGTGLGLIQCKDFVEKMNGEIKVQSQKNVGSTFSIILKNASSQP